MGSFKKAFKQEIVTPNQAEFGPFEELCVAKQRQDALNEMIVNLLKDDTGQPSGNTIEGVHFLFQTQSQIMAGIVSGIGEWAEERRRAERTEEAETGRIADDVRRVREAFIGEAAKAGAEPQIIAQALNMKRSTIESVVARLQGTASRPAAPAAATA